jgi:1-acyl-sn-glycerol-3-phosphate acyltransferase
MGKDSMWEHQPGNWLLSALGAFPVSRGTADREALERCIAILKEGEILLLYPEGERKSGPIVQPMFDGAAYVATKAGVPIVPVGIGGSEHVMTKGSWLIRPKKMHLIIGKPLTAPDGLNGRAPRPVVKDLTARLHDQVQMLFDEAQAQTH